METVTEVLRTQRVCGLMWFSNTPTTTMSVPSTAVGAGMEIIMI